MNVDRPRAYVAANVRAEAARLGLRQADLAGSLGVSQETLSRRLTGRVPFDVDELVDVAAALGVDPRELLTRRTSPLAETLPGT
jgi:transcriptional regulator with XRE-family HTH domain